MYRDGSEAKVANLSMLKESVAVLKGYLTVTEVL